jgi:hypothetical protein
MPQTETRKNTTSHYGANLFVGTVISADPGTLAIALVPDGQDNVKVMQGIPLAATFSHALGFKEPLLPNVGARVLCCSGFSGLCIIIGVIPPLETQSDEADANMPSRATFGTAEPLLDAVHAQGYFQSLSKVGIFNNQMPTDVVQGEKVIANEFGVLLGLFQMMAVLKGSELAQVQCHFLDDLVRVISHNFQHYHALGEHNIFHDGKGLHLEIGMTHDPIEGLGIPDPGIDIDGTPALTDTTTNTEGGTEFYKIEDERLKAIERLKVFIGKLGDFINILLVAPADEKRKLDGTVPLEPDRGLLQFHAGMDGLLIIRSVQGIILEKTNWIRVPTRIRTPEDPEGDKGTDINYEMRDAFDFDDTYTDSGTPFLYYLQLRDYLAYIEEERNYSGFKSHKKDFFLNDDISKETDLVELKYVDPITGVSFQKKRSIIGLMPNGGLSLMDTWGSAFIMEGGNIYVQPAKDIVYQPMRNFVVKAGGSIALSAKNDFDISCTDGGMRIKTEQSQYQYSNSGGIVLHAEGPAVAQGFVPYDTNEPLEIAAGIVLKAPNAGVSSYGMQVYNKATQNVVLNAQEINITADRTLELLGKTYTSVYGEAMVISSKRATEIYSGGAAVIAGETSTVVGKKNQVFGQVKGPFPFPVEGLLDEADKNKDFFTVMNKLVDTASKLKVSDRLLFFKEDDNFKKLKFYFLSSDDYGLSDSDVIPQTMVQLEEATVPGFHALEKWIEKPVNDTYPYPGADMEMSYVTSKLQNIKEYEEELINKTTDLIKGAELGATLSVFKDYTVIV